MFRNIFPKASRRKFGTLFTVYVMKLLREKARSIPEVTRIIEEEFGRKVSKGTIYPIFSSLEEEGLIKSKGEGKTKLYYLSKKGKVFLNFLKKRKEHAIKHLNVVSKFIISLIAEDKESREVGEVLSSIIARIFTIKDKGKVLKILKRCEDELKSCN